MNDKTQSEHNRSAFGSIATNGPRLLPRLKSGTMLLADRGYDADWIRTLAAEKGAWANIPPHCNRNDWSYQVFMDTLILQAAQAGEAADVQSTKGVGYPSYL
jgi:transposase